MTNDEHIQHLEKRAAALRDRLTAPQPERLELARVEREIANAKRPAPITVTAPRWQLVKDRADIIQARDFRSREFERQAQIETQRCGYRDPKHIAQHLRNVFGNTERSRRMADENDAKRIAHIDAQLRALDARESQTNEPPSAA